MKESGGRLEKVRISPTVQTVCSPHASMVPSLGGTLYFAKLKIHYNTYTDQTRLGVVENHKASMSPTPC